MVAETNHVMIMYVCILCIACMDRYTAWRSSGNVTCRTRVGMSERGRGVPCMHAGAIWPGCNCND